MPAIETRTDADRVIELLHYIHQLETNIRLKNSAVHHAGLTIAELQSEVKAVRLLNAALQRELGALKGLM